MKNNKKGDDEQDSHLICVALLAKKDHKKKIEIFPYQRN